MAIITRWTLQLFFFFFWPLFFFFISSMEGDDSWVIFLCKSVLCMLIWSEEFEEILSIRIQKFSTNQCRFNWNSSNAFEHRCWNFKHLKAKTSIAFWSFKIQNASFQTEHSKSSRKKQLKNRSEVSILQNFIRNNSFLVWNRTWVEQELSSPSLVSRLFFYIHIYIYIR